MTTRTIDESQRKAARVAGFAYLLTLPFVVVANFAIHDRLIVAGNFADTARNIMAHERLFRISIACDLIYCTGVVVVLTALYVILKPVKRSAEALLHPKSFPSWLRRLESWHSLIPVAHVDPTCSLIYLQSGTCPAHLRHS